MLINLPPSCIFSRALLCDVASKTQASVWVPSSEWRGDSSFPMFESFGKSLRALALIVFALTDPEAESSCISGSSSFVV